MVANAVVPQYSATAIIQYYNGTPSGFILDFSGKQNSSEKVLTGWMGYEDDKERMRGRQVPNLLIPVLIFE